MKEASKLRCPYCDYLESKVVDSRPTDEGQVIRRRRECINCSKRFTTYEKIEDVPIMVIKKDGTRETYIRNKLMNGIIRACQKRPVSISQMEEIADDIEKSLANNMEKEIRTDKIGEMVLNKLKDIDEVAYVRFASVYRAFEDLETFMEELQKLLKEK